MQTLETTDQTATTNQKRGALTGGALTLETLASSRSVLKQTRGGGTRGMQQFFTPPALAQLIKDVLDPDGRFCTLDLTAGDGSLLAPYFPGKRFGVEIDADQIKNARKKEEGEEGTRGYTAIHGDVQHIFPLLRLAGAQFSRVVLNLPFGLQWTFGKESISSAEATIRMGLGLLAPGGQGALIMGKERATREIITDQTLAKAVYAVLDIPAGTFAGVSLPTCVLFFGDPAYRSGGMPSKTAHKVITASADAAQTVRSVEAARDLLMFLPSRPWDSADADDLKATFKRVQEEHAARLAKRLGTQAADIALDSKSRISVKLSTIATAGIMEAAGANAVEGLQRLDGQRVNYFALNAREWQGVSALAAADLLTLDKGLAATVEGVIQKAAAMSCPVYPIKPQQRLAFLADTEQIECIKDDPKRGFVAGQLYPVSAQSRIAESQRKEAKEVTAKDGMKEVKELIWTRQAKVLDITVTPSGSARPVVFSEKAEDTLDLLAHFALPDPGDLATKFPQEMEKYAAILRRIEADILTPRGITLKKYQREDVCRLMMKNGGLLSWEQGLGKTLGAMLFAVACQYSNQSDGNALFIVPQDLIPQWQAEAAKFFGRELVWIKTRAQAATIRRQIEEERRWIKTDPFFDKSDRESAWYITHYEALSIGGTTGKVATGEKFTKQRADGLPTRVPPTDEYFRDWTTGTGLGLPMLSVPCEGSQEIKTSQGRALLPPAFVANVQKAKAIKAGYYDDGDGMRWHEARIEKWTATLTTEEICPQCYQQDAVTTDLDSEEWDGTICKKCGYTHKALHLKSLAHELTTCFKTGVIVVDEATKIKGESLQSLAVRGLRCRRKLILTGTPVKNYVRDLFHLLGWGLGYNSPRFPFAYEGGLEKFEKDFCVIEYLRGKDRKKVMPEVTNLSVLWKMLCGSIVRRRKEDAGEPLVPRTFVPVTVPMGTAQAKQYTMWLNCFTDYYCEKNPAADYNMVEMNSAILGQLHKLEYATTLPLADRDFDYWQVADLSDMTPKTLKVAEIAARHAARGECVLVGSDVMKTGRVVSDLLNTKGVPAAHILEESSTGKVQTKAPAARAGAVKAFRDGTTRVLCAGVQSINLGHNMDHASVVILDGLPWDFATLDQFLARVHRLTSERPVTVYVVMTEGSMDERKWQLLEAKTKSAELTLDGELSEKTQEPINLQAILREMQARGVPSKPTVDEAECARLWAEQAFTLRPVGSEITDAEQSVLSQPAKAKATADEHPALFQFETVKPKAKKEEAVQIQQGCLFAL